MRHAHWKVALMQYLADSARTPYQPGQHDCALFSAGAVAAMTGTDFAAEWRGTYTTIEEGLKALQKAGFADHIAMAAAHFEEVALSFAGPGDLAVIASPLGDILGVVQGEGVYVLTPARIGLWPLSAAHRAFKVV